MVLAAPPRWNALRGLRRLRRATPHDCGRGGPCLRVPRALARASRAVLRQAGRCSLARRLGRHRPVELLLRRRLVSRDARCPDPARAVPLHARAPSRNVDAHARRDELARDGGRRLVGRGAAPVAGPGRVQPRGASPGKPHTQPPSHCRPVSLRPSNQAETHPALVLPRSLATSFRHRRSTTRTGSGRLHAVALAPFSLALRPSASTGWHACESTWAPASSRTG